MPGELVRVIILADNEEEKRALRDDFISEMKKAQEEDLKGEGITLEHFENLCRKTSFPGVQRD